MGQADLRAGFASFERHRSDFRSLFSATPQFDRIRSILRSRRWGKLRSHDPSQFTGGSAAIDYISMKIAAKRRWAAAFAQVSWLLLRCCRTAQ
jgi:hypothetical protein